LPAGWNLSRFLSPCTTVSYLAVAGRASNIMVDFCGRFLRARGGQQGG
jgi:hypothetical protein